ncbi:MAG: orotidine-5'-phosphate decarboxylase [Phycisphaerae bacterium]|nr:orotidine-5'-phosphate decarboxylase [Phycisphaerae bacterium]
MPTASLFADRIVEAIRSRNCPGVINLDPVCASLPRRFAAAHAPAHCFDERAALGEVIEYCRRVLQIVAPIVPVVKLNIAYFECFRSAGVDAYYSLIAEAHRLGLLVIGDVKRGDVGHTAAMYASAHLAAFAPESADRAAPDAVTISGYFGWDGVKPFVDVARRENKGVFVLVRTSNESAASVQDVPTRDGPPVHAVVADLVTKWSHESGTIGSAGYGAIGAVVATRDPADAAALRKSMPHSIFLVPGYGAQGGRAEDFAPYVDTFGLGALIAAGRSVIFAHERPALKERFGDDWEACVQYAAHEFTADLRRVLPVR